MGNQRKSLPASAVWQCLTLRQAQVLEIGHFWLIDINVISLTYFSVPNSLVMEQKIFLKIGKDLVFICYVNCL
ncbi:hypothetical protein ACQFX9_17935 [Aliinostoc sp. HNIBRCY26]|uniref:hypothetical protein n=1 Tax=Aliinostoc sp. HNIBRCY26 TaxID=3418997 RepID=UPI003CFDB20E